MAMPEAIISKDAYINEPLWQAIVYRIGEYALNHPTYFLSMEHPLVTPETGEQVEQTQLTIAYPPLHSWLKITRTPTSYALAFEEGEIIPDAELSSLFQHLQEILNPTQE